MAQVLEKYFIEGGEVKPVIDFKNFADEINLTVYEVLRVIDGIPLFVDEHLGRLQNSVKRSGCKTAIDLLDIRNKILLLIEKNQVSVGNIKIDLGIFDQGEVVKMYFIPHSYPTEKDYDEGVVTGLLQAERINPEAKVVQYGVRDKANEYMKLNNLFEVFLVDQQGYIHEGSRSNIFFIEGNSIVTPPASTVLNGITRQKLISIVDRYCCNFSETEVHVGQLSSFESVFLTGTSPKILPVKLIDQYSFNPQNIYTRKLMEHYNKLLESYLSGFKRNNH